MELIEITRESKSIRPIADLTDTIEEIMSLTVDLYAKAGYMPPWIGYLAFEEKQCVGTCAFKAPQKDNCVEIAYFTFPEYEGKGVATRMAQTLLKVAFDTIPDIKIVAQTLPEENASTTVLKKLGFQFTGEREHPEDGKIWEWELRNPESK